MSLELEVAKVTPQEEAALAILEGTLLIRQVCFKFEEPYAFQLFHSFERVVQTFKDKRQLCVRVISLRRRVDLLPPEISAVKLAAAAERGATCGPEKSLCVFCRVDKQLVVE